MYSIKDRVAIYLSRTGVTRDELAQQLGITRQSLRSKLDGEVDFKLSEGFALAGILGCSLDDFRIPVDLGEPH